MAAKRPRHSWGSHTRAYRNRLANQAQQKWGLSRRSIREMYNRGTYKPGARNPIDRVPQKIQKQQITGGGGGPRINIEEYRELVYRKLDNDYQDSIKWTAAAQNRVHQALEHADVKTLDRLLYLETDVIRDLAKYQARDIENRTAPRRVLDSAWTDADGEIHNVFWYH